MGQYGGRENVYLLVGFDMKANPVEILYNEFPAVPAFTICLPMRKRHD
jgi:hypothetical protein